MPFTGFQVEYPKYEIITPQTKLSFTVRSLTVSEEERLKGSFVTPAKITEHLNRCLFDALVEKPQNIINFESFLKNVTIKDREALLYGLYHITYDEDRNYTVRCVSCGKHYDVTVEASDTFNFNPYPGDDIISKRISLNLKVLKNVTVVLKQPTLYDEWTAVKDLARNPTMTLDNITETLIIESIINEIPNGPTVEYTDRSDIIDAYKALPARDKRLIYKTWFEEIGQYGIELKMKSYCIHCGAEEVVNIDLSEQFFRAIFEA
ncbi:MAG: hypothetical protein KatS3mg002_0268 [Candidatus Woesearchaeota archaeon]|nr:MAG: hypothetical protein KatS3mg002_0268 [Candidatus Woesearchaeota archaeon]